VTRLRHVIADAHEVKHQLEIRRRRMQELVESLDARGDRRTAEILAAEISGYDRSVELLHDMVAYLEDVDQALGPAE
jgi:hypothetical protein